MQSQVFLLIKEEKKLSYFIIGRCVCAEEIHQGRPPEGRKFRSKPPGGRMARQEFGNLLRIVYRRKLVEFLLLPIRPAWGLWTPVVLRFDDKFAWLSATDKGDNCRQMVLGDYFL